MEVEGDCITVERIPGVVEKKGFDCGMGALDGWAGADTGCGDV